MHFFSRFLARFLALFSPYWGVCYIVAAVLIGFQHYWHDEKSYNNLKIFRASFGHLVAHVNLHAAYPSEYFDVFLYAPPAALLFAPLYYLPMFAAVVVWQLATSCLLWWAIKSLPLADEKKTFLAWFLLVEYTTALHNFQTNTWILAFTLLAFSFFEAKRGAWSGFFPMLGFFIKGFGGVGGFLLFFYPRFWRNAAWFVVWTILIGCSPGLVVGFARVPTLYSEWLTCLAGDHSATATERMMSLMSFIDSFFPTLIAQGKVQLIGLLLLVLFLGVAYFRKVNNLPLRLTILAFLLLWVVLFNHAAESSTHVISVAGVAIWYQEAEKNRMNFALLLLVFVLTSLSVTDLFPRFIRHDYIFAYSLKVVPVFLVWLRLQYNFYRTLSSGK